MAEGSKTDGPAPALNGLNEELAAAGFENARQVGKGGAGVVYRCYEAALGRHVAIKVLPSHFDDDGRERFLREGYAMGGLSGHPNIRTSCGSASPRVAGPSSSCRTAPRIPWPCGCAARGRSPGPRPCGSA